MKKDRIYLDNNATTPLHPEVLDAMMPYLGDKFGNPSSHHESGRVVRQAVDRARESVAELIGAEKPSEIIFTSGATESNNLALKGVCLVTQPPGHVIILSAEHPSILETVKSLSHMGFSTDLLPIDGEGRVNCEALALKITESTRLVSVMYANNETGNIYPVKTLAEMAHSRGALFHTDAVQAMGKIPVNVADLGVDLLSLSGHKMCGPKGTGALYVRSGVPIHPFIDGGGQERGYRSGTEHVPGIIGLGKACQIIQRDGESQRIHMAGLRDRLERGLLASLEDMYINGDISHRIPNTSNISFMGLEGESVAISLDLEGIEVSSGSACGTGAKGDSHVLAAMGLEEGRLRSAVRFSVGAENTMEEIETVIRIVPEVVSEMRQLSPRWRMEKS